MYVGLIGEIDEAEQPSARHAWMRPAMREWRLHREKEHHLASASVIIAK